MRAALLLSILFHQLALGVPEIKTTLAPVFDSKMVLQQGQPIPIFGTETPGQKITVTFAAQKKTTTAKPDGTWLLHLDPLPASKEPRPLFVSGYSTIRILDVLVGEVWLAAGQSNMDWTVSKSSSKPHPEHFPLIRMANWSGNVGASGNQIYTAQDIEDLNSKWYYTKDSWQTLDAKSVLPQSAVAYFFANALARELKDTPIGIIDISRGGTLAEAFIAPDVLRADPALRPAFENPREARTTGQWAAGRIAKNLTGYTHPDPTKPHPHPFAPGFLYEASMKHIVPFRFRGVIWYQGESNAEFTTGPYAWNGDRLSDYQHHVLQTLVTSWRKAFNDPDLPFYQVQLPRINASNRALWPFFREAQSRLCELPHVEQAVVTEFGLNGSNVHPANKEPVAERLAAIALNKIYKKNVASSGPVLLSHQTDGNSLALKFTHIGRELTTRDGQALREFQIAGADRKFLPATATIAGDTVHVSAPGIDAPVAVRYAWHMNTDGNLANADGLPASPFRTDHWVAAPGRTIRVACVGDSITAGVGTKNPTKESYPAQLATLLDSAVFEVRGFGHSGAGVHRPENKFDKHPQYKKALAYKPDIVICNLGINDITHWGSYTKEEFILEYRNLVDAFAASGEAPLIIIWHPLAPLFPGQNFHGSPNLETLNAWIADAAALTGVLTLDMHTALADHPEWFPDHIHPNKAGAKAIAQETFQFLQHLESN